MGRTRLEIGGRPATEKQDVERLQRALRKLRDERFEGSGKELARALGLSPSGVSQLISGRTTPSLGTLRRIARLCGVTIGELLDGRTFEAFPHRALAADIAREGGLSDEAIKAVTEAPADEDPPVWTWLKRIEAMAILGPPRKA